MNDPATDAATRAHPDLLDQARRATDAVVEARGKRLSVALDSGSVVEIERAFYDLFLDVYARGYQDGQSSLRPNPSGD